MILDGMKNISLKANNMQEKEYDYIIIGSGFGGSVAALRLTQKGYRVAVIEMGRRFKPKDFPKSNWDSRRYLWMPLLGWRGILRFDIFRHLIALRGTGFGGGSLVYGNTLIRPQNEFFEKGFGAKLNSKNSFIEYYKLAEKMMGVVKNPRMFAGDEMLKKTAEQIGRGATFEPSPVGVNFPENILDESNSPSGDPYFFGEGPDRRNCNFCGGCFTGCRYLAKNSLDYNYLFFAEKFGAKIITDTIVTDIIPLDSDGSDGYEIKGKSTLLFSNHKELFKAKGVIVSTGVIGTMNLLLRQKEKNLPNLSGALGRNVGTNSETLLGVRCGMKKDFSRGVSASSSAWPDDITQIQGDRYAKGSNLLSLLSTLLAPTDEKGFRIFRVFKHILLNPIKFLRLINPIGFAKETMILVVMQKVSSHVTMKLKQNFLFGKYVSLVLQSGDKLTTSIPSGNDFARKLADNTNGIAARSWTEALFEVPVTAHILGGALMSDDPEQGVVDMQNRVFGYKNFYICDGSNIGENLGVNPALTILALSERAMSFIPVKENRIRYLIAEKKWGTEYLLEA